MRISALGPRVPASAMCRLRVSGLQFYCVALLLTCLSALHCLAEPGAELVARMDMLRESIAEEQKAADVAEANYRDADKELRGIKADVERLKKEERTLTANLAKLEQSQTAAERDRVKLIEDQTRIRARLAERFRAAYLVPKSSVLAHLMSSQNSASVGLINRYLDAVYTYDTRLVETLRGVTKKIEAQGSSIRTLLTKQKTIATDLKQRQDAVAQKLSAQERVALLARSEQAKREKAVASLRAKLLRFEATLTGLTGGTYEVESSGSGSSVQTVDESFDGPGISKKLRAAPPVSGKVVARFGGTRRDGQPCKGLEIQAIGLERVRGIAAGRVVFSGELPGLGAVVVLDHGQRSFSLYGRLAMVSSHVGDILEAGAVVGEASGSEPLYFEVRQSGVAIDPRGFVKVS